MGNKETAFSFYQYVTTLRISSGLKKLCPDKQRELEGGLQFNVADCISKLYVQQVEPHRSSSSTGTVRPVRPHRVLPPVLQAAPMLQVETGRVQRRDADRVSRCRTTRKTPPTGTDGRRTPSPVESRARRRAHESESPSSAQTVSSRRTCRCSRRTSSSNRKSSGSPRCCPTTETPDCTADQTGTQVVSLLGFCCVPF